MLRGCLLGRAQTISGSSTVTDAELISATITASGLSVRRFAAEVLTRDPRTVWRWLSGENPLPRAVREKCEALLADVPPEDVPG